MAEKVTLGSVGYYVVSEIEYNDLNRRAALLGSIIDAVVKLPEIKANLLRELGK